MGLFDSLILTTRPNEYTICESCLKGCPNIERGSMRASRLYSAFPLGPALPWLACLGDYTMFPRAGISAMKQSYIHHPFIALYKSHPETGCWPRRLVTRFAASVWPLDESVIRDIHSWSDVSIHLAKIRQQFRKALILVACSSLYICVHTLWHLIWRHYYQLG